MSFEGFEFHHLGIAVADLDSGAASYKNLFGYNLVSGPFDDPIQKVSVSFLSRGEGDSALELVAPFGADSPVDRLLRKGGGLYHVCYEVTDIRQAIAHLVSLDSLLLSGPVPAVAFEMREIAWLMTDTNLLVELVQAP